MRGERKEMKKKTYNYAACPSFYQIIIIIVFPPFSSILFNPHIAKSSDQSVLLSTKRLFIYFFVCLMHFYPSQSKLLSMAYLFSLKLLNSKWFWIAHKNTKGYKKKPQHKQQIQIKNKKEEQDGESSKCQNIPVKGPNTSSPETGQSARALWPTGWHSFLQTL